MRHVSTYLPLLLATAVVIFVLVFVRQPGDAKLWAAVFNWGHAPLFGLFAALVFYTTGLLTGDRKITPQARYLATFLLSTSVGILTELMQHFTGGDAELEDLLRDVAGTAVLLAMVASFDASLRIKGAGRRRTLLLAAILILAATAVPAVLLSADYLRRDSAFPVVVDFSRSWGRRFLELRSAGVTLKAAPQGWPNAPQHPVALIAFRAQPYAGFVLQEPYPDWSGYDRLSFMVYSDLKEPKSIFIRIEDAHHNNSYADRFNRRIRIQPGINSVSIPLLEIRNSPPGRTMDMARIRRIILFAVRPPAPFSLYFDSLKLER